jgi:hypothetical protein
MRYKAKAFQRFEFSQDFIRFLLLERIMIEKDNVVLITGKRGDGKTTLALKLILGYRDMERVQRVYNEEKNRNSEEIKDYPLAEFNPFDMEAHMAFRREQLQNLCKTLKRSFILADEAVVNAGRRNAMTRANKMLHEIITINRKNLNTIFFCIPSIEDFDVSILQYITHWIHVDDRGLGIILLPHGKSIFGRKNWDVDKMKKIYDKFIEDKPTVNSVPYWLFDNFRGFVRFRALGVRTEAKYLDIAHREKNKDTDEATQGKTIIKKKFTDEQEKLMSELTDKLMNGKITDSADYYEYCSKLDFKKEKLNREINNLLIEKGDGRNATRIIKENKQKEEASYEKLVNQKKVIY